MFAVSGVITGLLHVVYHYTISQVDWYAAFQTDP